MKKRSFYRFIILVIGVFSMVSCVKTELQNISENTSVIQDFSVPLISRELAIKAPDPLTSSNVPGLYGSFYYNGLQFPNNKTFYNQNFFLGFNLDDSKGRANYITFLKFRINIENLFPTKIFTQVLLYNSNYTYSDSIFSDGPVEVAPATVDDNGKVISPGIKTIDVPFEGVKLEQLKTVNFMFNRSCILTQTSDGKPLKLSDENVIRINIATQIQLDYNIKEMFN